MTGNKSIVKINTGNDAYEYLKKKIDENTEKINENIVGLLKKTINSIRSQYYKYDENGEKITLANDEFDSAFYSAVKNNICAFIDNGVNPSDITEGELYSPDNFSFFYDNKEEDSSVTVSIYEVSSDNSTETLLFSYDEFKGTNKYLIILPFINTTKKIKMAFNKSTIKGVS